MVRSEGIEPATYGFEVTCWDVDPHEIRINPDD